jgi:predicted flap endonuclease-1-like 5' DNA nuclease
MERSVRSLITTMLVVAGILVAMNRIVENAPLGDYWLAGILLVLGLLIYIAEWRGRSEDAVPLVEPGHSSLDGYRQVAAPPVPAPAIEAPRVKSEAEVDYDDILEAYDSIRDTDVRSDGMASAATTETQETYAVQGLVQNIMHAGATGTFEEVDEIAGGPVESMSKEHAKAAPPSPTPEVTDSGTPATHGEYTDTQARSDLMASAATMDSPEAREAETGIVENIMETGATGTPEEVDEIAGGPVESMSPETAAPPPASSQPDDLTLIEGIGAKMDAALKAAGIDTFTRLATTSEADLRAAISAAGMRFAPSIPTWVHQASLAAKGNIDELKAYQKTLKAGRKK